MKTPKSRSEEKVVGFSSVSLFPQRRREAVTRVELWNQGERPLDAEKNLGSRSKARRTSKTAGAFHILSRKTRMTQARPPDPSTIEPILPPPHIYI